MVFAIAAVETLSLENSAEHYRSLLITPIYNGHIWFSAEFQTLPEGRYQQHRCWFLKFALKSTFNQTESYFFFTYLVHRLVDAIMEKFLEKLKIFALYAFSLLLMNCRIAAEEYWKKWLKIWKCMERRK